MNCIVTGASRGIGREVVIWLINNGHSVIALSRSIQKLENIKNEVKEEFAKNLTIVQCDICSIKDLDNLDRKVKSIFSELNIIVNNAGQLVNKPLLDLTQEDFESIYNANVWAPFNLVQRNLSLLRGSHYAHIVNISSVGGVQGSVKFPGLSLYSSSKGALNVLTECIAEELKDSNIRCNALALGAVQTEMLEEAFPGYKANVSAIEMAKYICKFAITDGEYVNGKIFSINSSTP